MSYLPLGTVVEISGEDRKITLMVVACMDKNELTCNKAYLGVLWPKGVVLLNKEEEPPVFIEFDADEIEKIIFIGYSTESVSRYERREKYHITQREACGDNLLPLGSVVEIEVSADSKKELQMVVVMGIDPLHKEMNYDYRVCQFDVGHAEVARPLFIDNSDIVSIKALGYINAEMQFLTNRNFCREAN